MREEITYIVEDPFGKDIFFTNKETATQYEKFITPINEVYSKMIDEYDKEELTHEKAKEYFKILYNSLKDKFDNDVTYHFRRFYNEDGTPFDNGADNEIAAITKSMKAIWNGAANVPAQTYAPFCLRNFIDKISKETPFQSLGYVYDEMALAVWTTYRDTDYIQKVLGK